MKKCYLPIFGKVHGKPHNPHIKPCDFYISPGGKSSRINYEEMIYTLQQENTLLKQNIAEAIELLSKGVIFCENDSKGVYDMCNIAINREKKTVEILKGSDN